MGLETLGTMLDRCMKEGSEVRGSDVKLEEVIGSWRVRRVSGTYND